MKKRATGVGAESAYELAAELRAAFSSLKRRLREHGGRGDVTPSQVAVLLRLERDGAATVSALARAEGMKPQSMSAIVHSLVEAGMLKGIADASDGRKMLMSLTKRCERVLQEVRAARQDWLTGVIAAKLSAQEQQQVAAALVLVRRLTEDARDL